MMLLANSVLSDADEDVTFFTFSQGEDCFPDLQKNVHVVPGFGKVLKLAWKLRNYDLIICGNPPMQFVAALAKLFGNKAHVVWWHHHVPWYSMENSKFKIQNSKGKGEICPPDKAIDSEANGLKSAQARRGGRRGVQEETKNEERRTKNMFFLLKRFMEKKFVIPRVDEHWVTSRYVGEVLREYAEVESMMVNPVLDEVFLRNQELGIRNQKKQPHSGFLIPDSSDKKVMITHGRLVPGKGHSTLFSVYENLRKDFPDLEFWVIGGGELRHEFECQNCDDEHVQFFGQLSSEEIVSKYQSANVAVFASSIDAFGMSALESQALGVDTVVLSKSGARESVVDSEFGYLVCDAQGMEDQIRRVLGGNSQKDKDIQSTHTHVYEPFSLSFFSSFLLNYIEEISK